MENSVEILYNRTRPVYVSVRNLCKSLSGKPILHNVCFDMYGGEVVGILGPNGSGKTTTIKTMLGLLKIDSGSVTVCGHDIEAEFEAALCNVGAIIENPELYKYLTAKENLMQFARMYDNVNKNRVDEVIRLVRLENRQNDKVSSFSLGMRQRLGIAQALLHYPKVIILDEPTNGLDPAGIKELRDILRDLSENYGVSVLISSHQLAELQNICDRIIFIDRGCVVDSKLMSDIKSGFADSATDVMIETEAGEAVRDLFISLGYKAVTYKDGAVLFARAENVPEITKALVTANLPFTSVTPKKKTLEDAFFEVTTNFTQGGIGV